MVEGLSDVASILTGNEQPAGDESPPPATEPPAQEIEPSATIEAVEEPAEKPATLTVKQVAERLESTPKELYESLMIDIGGESMSLSEVKDRGKDLFGADKKLADSDAYRLQAENDILRQNQALTLRAERMGGNATQAEQEESQRLHNDYVVKERDRALAVLPEWSNPAVQQAEVRLVTEMLTDAGYSPHEIANKVDHRDVKIYREYAVLKDRLASVGKTEVHSKANQQPSAKRKSAPTNKGAKERYESGELTQQQAVLRAIADG